MTVRGVLYDWGGANAWLFHIINGVHGPIIDRTMLLGTFFGAHQHFPAYAAAIALVSVAATGHARRMQLDAERVAARWLSVLAVFMIGYYCEGLLVVALKHAFDFPRPAAALPPDAVHIVGHAQFRYSLPSGHTAFATLLAASLWPLLPRLGRVVAVLFAVWVALSRVSLGAHFPADVVAGALVGYGSIAFARLGVRRILT